MDQIASFQISLVSTPLPILQDPLHLPTILDRGCQASKTQGSTLLQQLTWGSITRWEFIDCLVVDICEWSHFNDFIDTAF